jgi:aldose 1-epimerase
MVCTAVAARGGETPPSGSSAAKPSAGEQGPSGLRVVKEPFGTMPDGAAVALYTLSNGSGLRVKITPFGAAIVAVETPDRAGKWANVTTGIESFERHLAGRHFQGTIVGRFANRIAKGRFTIDGKEFALERNSGANHIHGGKQGFDRVLWKAEAIEGDCPSFRGHHVQHGRENGTVPLPRPTEKTRFVGLRLTYLSRDGEEGYPGNLSVTCTYTVGDDDSLTMAYEATTDKPTHVNLTNHAYWNLSGGAANDVLEHQLTLFADAYLPVDAAQLPLGDPLPVKGTHMDFTRPMAVGSRIAETKGGYDHCYVLRKEPGKALSLAARVVDPTSGRAMEVYTTQPGVQLYTDNGRKHRCLCLETQHYPDSPNRPAYPTTLLRPGEKFSQTTVHRFSRLAESRE